MVTAGGDGKIIQQGWRALDCGVLGVLLVTCLASWGPIMACHGAAGSRGMLERKGRAWSLLHVKARLWLEKRGLVKFSRPAAVVQLPIICCLSFLPLPLPLLTRYHSSTLATESAHRAYIARSLPLPQPTATDTTEKDQAEDINIMDMPRKPGAIVNC